MTLTDFQAQRLDRIGSQQSAPAAKLLDASYALRSIPLDTDMLNEADAEDTAPKNLLDTDPELATVPLAELQTRYGTNVKTLRTHIAEGKLRAIKVGKGYRVTVAAVRDWLKLHEVQPGSEE